MDALRHPVTARFFSGMSLFFFTFVFYFSPFAMAVTQELNNDGEAIVLTGTPEQKMNQGLLKLKALAASKKTVIDQRIADGAADNVFAAAIDKLASFFGVASLTPEDISELEQLAVLLAEQHQQALASFAQLEAQLVAKALPEAMMQRHHDTVALYQLSYDEMLSKIQAVLSATDLADQQVAMNALDETMSKHKLKKTHQSTDPDNLPWGTPDAAKTRAPGDTTAKLVQLTGIKPLAARGISNAISADVPDATDLAETPDIQLTDAIKAKALALNNDPLEIYNWVRNNIEFIPSYGSIQGADYTLQHGKGNAFDTASLLIALLRSANVPARYAYGTVKMPVEQVMNWVGGVDVPEAAQQLLGQGGIPNVALVYGGKVTHIRLETVWAEAWVDYFPSRGAKHVEGDSWIPLDASFKQYDFTQSIDFATNVPLDTDAFLAKISQNGVINQEQGYVQGINQVQVEAALSDHQQKITDYIDNQNPAATLGEVLGIQKVIVQSFVQLAAGLPYKLVARTANYAQLPDNLRHKFRYTLGNELYGTESNRLMTFEQSLPELAGKKLAVSFRPATQGDRDLMDSYLPQPDPVTGEINPNQAMGTVPGYLINLVAEFSQQDQVIESAGVGTMGGELYETLALWSPSSGWSQAVNHPTAGEYRAIGLDLQGVNAEQAAQLKLNFEAIQDVINNGNSGPNGEPSIHQVTGDILYSVIYNYLSINDIQDQIEAQATGMVNYRLPSYGLFTTNLQTSYFFGVPRNVDFAGVVIDVDRLATQSVAKDNNSASIVSYLRSSGARASGMEHIIPEKMFSTPEHPAQGISAVKAISIAARQGQRIWNIDSRNLTEALAAIDLGVDIENEIKNAVHAGKTATTHELPIDFSGGTNTGYLLLDPQTGAGAYLIASGASGGFLSSDFADFLGFAGFAGGLIGAGFGIPLLSFIAAAIALILIVSFVLEYRAINHRCDGLGGILGLAVIAGLVGIFASPLMAVVWLYVGVVAAGASTTAAGSSACRN